MKLKLPTVRGLIARRVLVNYRVDPTILAGHLPAPFRPKLVNGFGIAGICLIRLEHMRPRFAPVAMGATSENAAHRIAVEWDDDGQTKEGVFIPVRHTDSKFNAFVGGRLFPGVHRHAKFWTAEAPNRVKVDVSELDDHPIVRVAGRVTNTLSQTSVFDHLENASHFFQCGTDGWSPNHAGTGFEGLKLATTNWAMQPLHVEHVFSNWLDDTTQFPKGSVAFDSAFLMRNIEHEWITLPPFQVATDRRMPVPQERRKHEPNHP